MLRQARRGGVGSRPLGTPPQGVRPSPFPTGRAPGGRPAVETRPWRPGEPPGGPPRHTSHWKAEVSVFVEYFCGGPLYTRTGIAFGDLTQRPAHGDSVEVMGEP